MECLDDEILKKVIKIKELLCDVDFMNTDRSVRRRSQKQVYNAYNILEELEKRLNQVEEHHRFKFGGNKDGI